MSGYDNATGPGEDHLIEDPKTVFICRDCGELVRLANDGNGGLVWTHTPDYR